MKNKNKQTKFPVARIKKIMQKDEEVGKVAQATPIVISKALELFLGLIIEQSSKVTSERGSKKLEVYHLKHAVETTETLDFLKELVQDIPDPTAGGTIDLESEAAEQKKKRGKGKRNAPPGEPNAVPKRRRKKKIDAALAEAAEQAGVDEDDRDGGEGSASENITPPDDRDEDTEMQDQEDENEYDEEPEPRRKPILAPDIPISSYRIRSPSYDDDDDWEDNKPYLPPKM